MTKKIKAIISKYGEIPEGAKASIWFTICTVIQRGISVLTVPIFTRLLSTDQYGVFNVYNSWYGIISVFVTLNLSWSAYTVALAKNENDADRLTSALQNVPIFLSGLGAIIAFLGGHFWEKLIGLSWPLFMMIFVEAAFVTALQLWSCKERYYYRYKSLVGVTVAMAVLSPLIGIVLIQLTDYKAEARIIATVIVNTGFGLYFYIRNQKKGKVLYVKEYWKFAFVFCLPLIPHYLSQSILNQSDRIMINNMVGSTETAIYSVAYSVASIFTIVNTAINHSYTPWLYRQIKNNHTERISGISNALIAFVLFLNLLYICVAPELIVLFAPPDYEDAVSVVPPLALSSYLIFIYQLFIAVELYFEKTKQVLWSSLLAAVMNVGLNYVFIGLYGYHAAGYTSLFCYIVYVIGHYFIMKRIVRQYCNYSLRFFNGKMIGLFSVVGLLITALIISIYDYAILRYIIVLTGLLIVFLKRNQIKISLGKLPD